MFDTDGHWVDSVDMLADDARYIASTHGNEEPGGGKEHALFLVFEGGQFIWPGIEIGFKRPVTSQQPLSIHSGFWLTREGR